MAIFAPTAEQARRVCNLIPRQAALTEAFDNGRLIILTCADAATLALDKTGGLIIGPVFRGTAPAQRVTHLPPLEAQAIASSHGQILIDTFWGGYVAVIASPDPATVIVLRDPSGAMPCYIYNLTDHITIVVSDVETLWKSGLCSLEIDIPALTRLLLAYDLRGAETCLAGLTEVPAGHRLKLGSGIDRLDLCWAPEKYARITPPNDATVLAERLLETTQGVIRAWAGVFDHPLLGVSGGLDSSVIASVLASTTRPVTLLTMATDEGDGDERPYTRILGEALNVPVQEGFHQLDQIDVTRATSAHLPRPILLAFGQSEHTQKQEIALAEGVDAFFTGVGGDNVFCSMHSVLPLVDRIRLQGPFSGAWRTAADLCRLTGCSLPELGRALLKRLFRWHDRPWPMDLSFLSAAALNVSAEKFDHPWLQHLSGIPPGKRQHIAMLARIQGTIDGYSRYDSPLLVNPLLSQPLMELCLGIPTWAWVSGGRDRAVTRRAFSGQLPAALLDRRSKGTPNSFAFEVVDRHRDTIRAHLLDGFLAASGLIDTAAIEQILTPGRPLIGFEHMRLATLMEADVWCRLWQSRHGQAKRL